MNKTNYMRKKLIRLSKKKKKTFLEKNTNETYSLRLNCRKSTIKHSWESLIPDKKDVQTTVENKGQYNEKGNTHTNHNTTYIHRKCRKHFNNYPIHFYLSINISLEYFAFFVHLVN